MTTTAQQADGGKPVGIWIRVSTEDQARGDSPATHEHRARAYAEYRRWEVAAVYRLEGVSGKAVMDHPEAQRMLADVEAGRIAGLIFSAIDRLGRNVRELLDFAAIFRKHGADLVSLRENMDTSTPGGLLVFTVLAAMAQWEREQISARQKASVQVRAELNKPLGGVPPFGYHWVDGALVPHPEEAQVLARMFTLFLEHKRVLTVTKLLNAEGHRTRKGKPFRHASVRKHLTNPVAKGVRLVNYSRQRADGKGAELKPREEWIEREVPAVVPAATWDAVNAVLDGNAAAKRSRARRPVHLFAGLVVCTCGAKMYVPSNNPKYTCKQCKNKMPVDALEECFRDQLRGFLFAPTEVEAAFAAADKTLGDLEARLAGLARERDRAQAAADKLFQLHVDDNITGPEFRERNRPLRERLVQLDAEYARLEGEATALRVQRSARGEALHEAQSLSDRWDALTAEEKRKVVEIITEGITVGEEEVEVALRALPFHPATAATSATTGGRSGRRATRPSCSPTPPPSGIPTTTPPPTPRTSSTTTAWPGSPWAWRGWWRTWPGSRTVREAPHVAEGRSLRRKGG